MRASILLMSIALGLATVGCGKKASPTAPVTPAHVVFDHWGTQYRAADGYWRIVGWCRNDGGTAATNVYTWGPASVSGGGITTGNIAMVPTEIPAGALGQWTEVSGNGSDPGPSGGRALDGSDVTIWWDGGFSGP